VLPIIMVLVGGGVGVYGGIIGAVAMTWFTNAISGIQRYSGVTYAIVLMLLLLFVPTGLLGIRIPLPAKWRSALDPILGRSATFAASAATATSARPAAPAAVAECPPIGDVMMEVHGVSVVFGGLKALDTVSLELRQGTITALIGPNGAGKTTLFNAISRQQVTQGGSVLFKGTDLIKLSTPEAARMGIARTFQNLRIFTNMSVMENVLVGCHRHERSGFWSTALGLPRQRAEEKVSQGRALDALRLVGLEGRTKIRAASLPYGQQRLVEIARALASGPELLLLDEPAAGMNSAEQVDLAQKIRAIRASGVTVLLVEHSMDLVMGLCDIINVLDHGQLIATGCPDDIKSNPRVIEAYLGTKHPGGDKVAPAVAAEAAPPAPARAGETFLSVDGVETCYGTIKALHGVSLSVSKGEVLAVLGPNGAGKTTLLLTISGILQPTAGKVMFDGEEISRMSAVKIVSRGLCQVPEGRRLFPTLSVENNLLMGVSGKKEWRKGMSDDMAYIYDLFPILGERRRQEARTLSGGEQQMLAIGRALMGQPKLLLLDEPSMGLSPVAADRIFEALATLNQGGLTLLMVEQNANRALELAERVVVLRTGTVVLEELASELRNDDRLHTAYLG
jgi:ABC-type branched-subunit amino acid transport system ATPase component